MNRSGIQSLFNHSNSAILASPSPSWPDRQTDTFLLLTVTRTKNIETHKNN